MEIRAATSSDIDALLRLSHQIGALHFEQAPHAFVAPSLAEREFMLNALNDPARLFLLAQRDNQIVGFITAIIAKNEAVPFLLKDPICRVGTLVVDENERTSGIGRMLMTQCQQWAKQQGAIQMRLEVMSFNYDAQAFYEKLGFAVLSKTLWMPIG